VPLGARDVFIVIHAKDQASRVISGVGRSFSVLGAQAQAAAARQMMMGSAMLGLGTAMGIMGAVGVAALFDMTQASIEYSRQASLTLTQVDQTGASLQQIKDIGRDVASAIPAPFEQMQAALFDIFSSMDVTVAESQTLLEGFAKASVAGQTDVQTAGRATIAILNAWDMGADQLNRVLDVQFQLVRKGVGTYEEFATAIGRAIPSARRAGQEVETLAGMLAFLTRNGLSADMAATSAARAFDALAHPKTVQRLQEMGVTVFDASGNFLQMNEIIPQLATKLEGLTDPQKAAALQALFQGSGGTIQARRFFDLAIRNYEELNQRVDEMINSAGALEDAYQIMFDDPAMAMQLLKNNWEILRTEMGDALVPVLMTVVRWLTRLFQAFNDLDPDVQAFIARFALAASALLIFFGVLIALAGAFLILKATADMVGLSLLAMGGLTGLIVGGIIGLAALVIKNWDSIAAWFEENMPGLREAIGGWMEWLEKTWKDLWPVIQETARAVWDWIEETWTALWPTIQEVAREVWDWLSKTWEALWPHIKDVASRVWDWIVTNAPIVWGALKGAAETAHAWFTDTFLPWWSEVFWPKMEEIWAWLVENVPPVWEEIERAVKTFWEFMSQNFWPWFRDEFWPGFVEAWSAIAEHVGPIIRDILIIIAVMAAVIMAIWNFLWPALGPILSLWWNSYFQIIEGAWQLIRGIFEFFAGLLTGDWEKMWEGLQNIVQGAVTIILAPILLLWGLIVLAWEGGREAVINIWNNLWDFVEAKFKAVADLILAIASALWNGIVVIFGVAAAILSAIWSTLWGFITTVFQTAINTLSGIFSTLIGYIQTVIGWINTVIGWIQNLLGFLETLSSFVLDGGGILGPLGDIQGNLQGTTSDARTTGRSMDDLDGKHARMGVSVDGLSSAISQLRTLHALIGNVPGAGAMVNVGNNWTGGPVFPGMTTWVGEFGPELMSIGTGGSYGRITPHALAARTIGRGTAPSNATPGTMVNLIVQGPIKDRNDLVYRAGQEMDWHDFTMGR